MELLLDHFQVEACYLQEQAILAMYSYSAISGIVGEITFILTVFQSKCNEKELTINTNIYFPFFSGYWGSYRCFSSCGG